MDTRISVRNIRVWLASLVLLLLLVISASGQADDDIFETRTINGHKFELSQVGQGDYRARVDGKEILKSGPPKAEMSLEGVHSGDGKVYAVLSRGSQNCPARLFGIDLSGPVPLVSKPMGNCSEQSIVEVVDGVLRVMSPVKAGGGDVTTFFAGQTQSGQLSSAAAQAPSSPQAASSPAKTGKCVLRVDGNTYLNGPCNIGLEKGGDFKIAPLREVNPYYFAYVSMDSSSPGTATGSWNGKEAENHAHDDLGTLTRKGACWSNAHAEICAVAR